MKKPIQHQIDEEAQVILKDKLPKVWVKNEHKSDYGIDYHVTIGNAVSNEVTGEVFYIQLKGHGKAYLFTAPSPLVLQVWYQ